LNKTKRCLIANFATVPHNFLVLCYFLGQPFSMVVLLKSSLPEKNKRTLADKIKKLNLSSEQEVFLLSLLEENDGTTHLSPVRKKKKAAKNKQGR
jgi:hypothetical protein